jgi:hypothetical protein
MRRHDYWASQQPRYFFFFEEPALFPGFGDCLPSTTAVLIKRGGDACVESMRTRLSESFPEVFGNTLFTVFDLSAPVTKANRRIVDRIPKRIILEAVARSPRTIVLTWSNSQLSEHLSPHIEMKRSIQDNFTELGIASRGTSMFDVTGLAPATRYFFRARFCRENACSHYAYAEAWTLR